MCEHKSYGLLAIPSVKDNNNYIMLFLKSGNFKLKAGVRFNALRIFLRKKHIIKVCTLCIKRFREVGFISVFISGTPTTPAARCV